MAWCLQDDLNLNTYDIYGSGIINITNITISGLNSSQVLVTNTTGQIITSVVTSTELDYLTGITGNIQAQIDAKATSTGYVTTGVLGAHTGNLNNPHNVTLYQIGGQSTGNYLISNTDITINSLNSITATEINYMSGVTGYIQTQINNLAPTGYVSTGNFGIHTGNLNNPHSVTIGQIGAQPLITGAATSITGANLPGMMALVSTVGGKIGTSSSTTYTELSYVNGVIDPIQTQLNNKQGSGLIIPNVKSYGAVGNDSNDDTTAINTAILNNGIIYIPEGTYKITGPLIVNDYKNIFGAGTDKTIIKQYGNTPTFQNANAITASRGYFQQIKNLSVEPQIVSTSSVLDMRAASYMILENLKLNANNKARGIIVDNGLGSGGFNGYNNLINVYTYYGATGYYSKVNDLNIIGGVYNVHSGRGISLLDSACVNITGPEVAGNGPATASYSGIYPTGRYNGGGILLDNCSSVNIRTCWFENNSYRGALYSRNDIETLSNCKQITASNCRWDKNDTIFTQYYGLDLGIEYNNGLGNQQTSTLGLINNGQMILRSGNNVPLGWNYTTITGFSEPSTLPSNVKGIHLTADSGAYRWFYQTILSPADCVRLVNQKLHTSFWVNDIDAGYCRVGLATAANGQTNGNSYMSASSSTGVPMFATSTYTILGTEAYGVHFTAEIYDADNQVNVEIGNVSASIGDISWANYDKSVTTQGGDIWSPSGFKIGGKRHSYGSGVPTLGPWAQGDIVYNSLPTVGGYLGWVCMTGGTPGQWRTWGAIV